MSSFILFKVWSFSKRNFSEFIRCVGLKCSDSDLKGKGQGERKRKLSLSRVMIVRSSYVPLFASLFASPRPPPPPRTKSPGVHYLLELIICRFIISEVIAIKQPEYTVDISYILQTQETRYCKLYCQNLVVFLTDQFLHYTDAFLSLYIAQYISE